jgi:uncharacterized membrane protein
MFTPEMRRYIYGIVTAAMPLLITMGAVSTGLTQQILLLAAAVLGVSTPAMANANVSKTETPEPVEVPKPTAQGPVGPVA